MVAMRAATQYCSLITRGTGPRGNSTSGSAVTDVLNKNVNIGGIKTEGVDLSTHYKFPSTSVGDFKAGLDWTFTKQYVLTTPYGAGQLSSQELSGTTSLPGTIGGTTVLGGIPKQRGTVSPGLELRRVVGHLGHDLRQSHDRGPQRHTYSFFEVPPAHPSTDREARRSPRGATNRTAPVPVR